jgi:hypothetical protein
MEPWEPDVLMSPDGSIKVELYLAEWRMSLWTKSPRVIALPSGTVLLDLAKEDWDAKTSWPGPGIVQLDLRRYAMEGACCVVIDPAQGVYRLGSVSGTARPIDEVQQGVEAAFAQAHAALPAWTKEEPTFASLSQYDKRYLIGAPFIFLFCILAMVMSVKLYLDPQEYAQTAKAAREGETLGPLALLLVMLGASLALGIASLFAMRRSFRIWRQWRARGGFSKDLR